MSKRQCWIMYDFTGNGSVLRNVPDYDSFEALLYLYGIYDGSKKHWQHWSLYSGTFDAIEYAGKCLADMHFDMRFYEECLFLGLTVDDSEPTRDYAGVVEDWSKVKKLLDEAGEVEIF